MTPTLGVELGVGGASRNEVCAAMDWLLARWRLAEGAIAMFDLSCSWLEGRRCELAARGDSRDGRKGQLVVEQDPGSRRREPDRQRPLTRSSAPAASDRALAEVARRLVWWNRTEQLGTPSASWLPIIRHSAAPRSPSTATH